MNVLFICQGLSTNSIVAQPWKHVFEIAKRSRQMGNDCKIVTDQTTGLDSSIEGVPLLTVNRTALSFDADLLSKLINAENPDIINWHCSDVWSSLNLWRLRNKIRSRMVWTLHSGILSFEDLSNLQALDYFQLYKYWNNIFNAVIPKRIIRKWLNTDLLAHVITLSHRTARKLGGFGVPEEMVTHIPSGVDVDVFKSLDTVEDRPRILYFGPLDRLRGTDTLLSAFEQVQKTVPTAHLTLLARETHYSRTWERRINRFGSVELATGILGPKKTVEKLDTASVIVLPFRFWPQVDCPLTVLEAMAMKKATVSTSTGAIPELILNGETGFLVPAKNPAQLAKSIIDLLTDRELSERIGQNARARVELFYDWNIITKRTIEVLSNVSD